MRATLALNGLNNKKKSKNLKKKLLKSKESQVTFTCSKSAIEALEKGMKYFQS